jgi:hypothetical protein
MTWAGKNKKKLLSRQLFKKRFIIIDYGLGPTYSRVS